MTALHRFDLATIPPMPWKNGGGATRELACWPPGAGMDAFAWRVSVATIDQPGPFSAFAGVDRQIMLLEGDGVHLHAPDGCVDHALDRPWRPFTFSGDVALHCTLLGGTSTDFNLMLRRGAWQGAIEVLRQPVQPGTSPAGLCLVLAGVWECAGAMFTAGQGLWWGVPAVHAMLSPCATGNAQECDAPVLAWIALAHGI